VRAKDIPLSVPARVLTPAEADWPESIGDLPDPPLWLRVAGNLPCPDRATVAIVGTRYADDDAVRFARELAADLGSAGLIVISGGAYGIDAAAHEGALEAGGTTVTVLATGFREAYPPRHGPLFGRIAENGALVTEATDDQRPLPGLFLRRNRLIAALADAVVVVQAPVRSGALSTASWARRLRRPLLAVPAAPWDSRGQGSLGLLRKGAKVCTSARDVLSVRSPGADTVRSEPRESVENGLDPTGLDEDERSVLAILGRLQRYPDEIARNSGIPVSRVQRALLSLRLHGMIEERGDGRYAKTAR
jgi:DNA processing protein